MRLGTYLQDIRSANGFSQTKFVEALSGVDDRLLKLDVNTLSRYERGASNPTLARKQIIMSAMQKLFSTPLPASNEGRTMLVAACFKSKKRPPIDMQSGLVFDVPSYFYETTEIETRSMNKEEHHLSKMLQAMHQSHSGCSYILDSDALLELTKHPRNALLISTTASQMLGAMLSLTIKPDCFEQIKRGEKEIGDLGPDAFPSENEKGVFLCFFFYSQNMEIAEQLQKYFASKIIINADSLTGIGVLTSNPAGDLASRTVGFTNKTENVYGNGKTNLWYADINDFFTLPSLISYIFI